MNNQFDKRISRLFLISASVVTLVVTVCLSTIFFSTQISAFSSFEDNLSAAIIESKKQFLFNTVNRTIADIDHARSRCSDLAEPYDTLSGQGGEAADAELCLEDRLKERLQEQIRQTRLIDDGYIWVNEVLNYQGGDGYAVRLVHPNLTEEEGTLLSTGFQDIKGNTPYLTELEGVRDHGEIYFQYWFKKMNSDEIAPKLTYAKLYKEYDWIIASGVYLDDLDATLATQQQNNRQTLRTQIMLAAGLGLIACIAALLISLFFLRRINNVIGSYKRESRAQEESLEKINSELEQRVAERTREIEESRAQLQASEKKFLDLYDNAPDMYVSVDAKTAHVIECNKTLYSRLGRSREEIIGAPIFTLYHPDSHDAAEETFAEFVKTGTIRNRELQLLTSDGSPVDVSLNVTAERDENGTILYSRSSWRDITELKRVEAERLILQKRLIQAEKMESIGNLAGGIAHDFNNLLSAIMGFTELALDEVEPGSELEDSLQEVYTAGGKARDLVKQILAFARQSDEERVPVQLSTIVKEVLKFIRSTIPSTIEISQDIGSFEMIEGNPTQVHQMLVHLCTNASHAMAESGGVLNVGLNEVTIDGTRCLQLTVADTGTGIDPEIIEAIFEPYFTTKPPGEGTGIGLAMVKGVVESYNGSIEVESTPGEGTNVTIHLPITSNREQNVFPRDTELPKGSGNLLVVDDEPAIVKMTTRLLESLGYRVDSCTDSLDALARFREAPQSYDLVLTDMTMPNLTGEQLCAELLHIRPGLPIILCTGYSDRISPEQADSIGISAFLYKPVIKAQLAQTVLDLLDTTH